MKGVWWIVAWRGKNEEWILLNGLCSLAAEDSRVKFVQLWWSFEVRLWVEEGEVRRREVWWAVARFGRSGGDMKLFIVDDDVDEVVSRWWGQCEFKVDQIVVGGRERSWVLWMNTGTNALCVAFMKKFKEIFSYPFIVRWEYDEGGISVWWWKFYRRRGCRRNKIFRKVKHKNLIKRKTWEARKRWEEKKIFQVRSSVTVWMVQT